METRWNIRVNLAEKGSWVFENFSQQRPRHKLSKRSIYHTWMQTVRFNILTCIEWNKLTLESFELLCCSIRSCKFNYSNVWNENNLKPWSHRSYNQLSVPRSISEDLSINNTRMQTTKINFKMTKQQQRLINSNKPIDSDTFKK